MFRPSKPGSAVNCLLRWMRKGSYNTGRAQTGGVRHVHRTERLEPLSTHRIQMSQSLLLLVLISLVLLTGLISVGEGLRQTGA